MRKIAMLLAFVFFVSIIPNYNSYDVYGATKPTLGVSMEKSLTTGTNNDNPVYNLAGQPVNAWLFDWNTSVEDFNTANLKYQIEPNKSISVTTTKNGEDLDVVIKIVDDTGAPQTVANNLYTIYSNVSKDYASINKFFNASGDKDLSYNGYDNKEVLYNTTLNQASFKLNKDSSDVGYSIRYGGYEFHFLLKSDGTFTFYQVGKLVLGRIYEAVFTYEDASNNVTTTQRDFSIGLSITKNISRPFVDVASISAREYAEDKYNIAERSSISVLPPDKVGFEYSVALPLKYDKVTKTFTKAVDSKSSAILTFETKSGEPFITTQIDIGANESSATKVSETLPAGASSNTPLITASSHQLAIEYFDLESGLILNPVISYQNDNLRIKNIEEEATKAYTFPEYSILKKDGQDYVSIVPFKDYAGHYVLYSGLSTPSPSGSTLAMSSSYFKESAKSKENILLALAPIPASGRPQDYDYKIFFNPDVRFKNPGEIMINNNIDNVIRTRYFSYLAQDVGAIGFPNNFTITNTNQSKMFKPDGNYPSEGSGNYVDNFQDVSYTLSWDIGKVTSVDKLLATNTTDKTVEVDYIVALGDTVETNEREDFLNVKITLDGSGGDTNAILKSAIGDYLVTSTTKDPLNTSPSAKDPKSNLNNFIDARLVTAYSSQASGYVYRIEVDLSNVAIDKTEKANMLEVAKKLYFEYSNIYFFAVRPAKVTIDGAEQSLTSPSSVIKSLTLNKDLSIELQEPVNILANNVVTQFKDNVTPQGSIVLKDKVSFEISYEQKQQSIANFMNYYFTNYDLQTYGQNMLFTNDIYISQDIDLLKTKLPNLTKAQRIANSVELYLPDGYTDSNVNDKDIPVVMMRDFVNNAGITNPYPDPTAIKTAKGNYGIDVLRNGEVLRISNVPLYDPEKPYELPTANILNKLEINGLDTNTKYYIFVDTNAKYQSPNNQYRYLDNTNSTKLDQSSNTSAMSSATTGSNLQKPSIIDEVPTMPDINLVDVGRNNYVIDFNKINMTVSDTNRYKQEFQYEVLRLRDTPLKEAYLDTRKDLQHVFKNELGESVVDKYAQLLYEDSSKLPSVMLYDEKTNTFINPSDPNYYLQKYDGSKIIYQDNTLSANKVYFVYVRTVRVITDLETGNVYRNYSAWDALSTTSKLGDSPIDLEVIYNYDKTYDAKVAIPLQFRAKVSNLNDIGSDVTFQVTYRYDGKEWVTPITISSSELRASASALDADGYRTFKFLLTGLEAGKTYSIKVRQANVDGSTTPYSNIVQWKTDIDEDDYDKKDDLDDFKDLMDDLVDRIIDGSQITVSDDKNGKVIMINGNNLANEISGSKANTLLINTLEKGKSNTIILPMEAYQKANAKNLAWQYSYGDMFFNTSANTLNTTYNSSVIAMNKDIARDYVEDYYVEINFDYKSSPTTLQGDTRLTDVVKISTNLRAVSENILDFQNTELETILEKVENSQEVINKKNDIIRKLEYKSITNEEALVLVDEYVSYVQARFQNELRQELNSIKRTYYDKEVTTLDKSIIMGTTNQNILNKVTAYSVNSTNVALPLATTRSKDVSTAVVKEFGTYGFGGNAVSISGNVNNSNSVSNIIAQNDLEDTLSTYGSGVVTGEKITVSQALVAVSNILDLSVAETKTLLSSKGVSINRNNETKNLNEDLAYAIIGVLYEAENGISADKVSIKDYKFYESLNSAKLNQGYVKYIQLCKEVGIISKVPSTSNGISTGDFLSMLTKI